MAETIDARKAAGFGVNPRRSSDEMKPMTNADRSAKKNLIE
ncbi:hypothetical protein U5A82_13320 [Sphingobium sp. CR2-8]|nr:hypothetical protein [Sphingobium sp. CR2-8]MEC3911405.1 hypothetical protein [Sphingobium sp. CR2-8]